jgi:exosome complex RNA-binding protein Rrp4
MLDRQFNDKESLVSAVKQHYAVLAVSIFRSKNGKVWIGCDRGGSYRNNIGLTENTRKRQTASPLVGCQFKIVGKWVTENKWSVIEVHNVHNHEASNDMSGHQSSRKLNDIQNCGWSTTDTNSNHFKERFSWVRCIKENSLK